MSITFPFKPKSNTKLKPGFFWPVKLSNGNFGCGIVLDIPSDQDQSDKRSFFLGLLNWTSNVRPTIQGLESTSLKILKYGYAHIKTITVQDEEILGMIDLDKNKIDIDLLVDSQYYSNSSYVFKGFQVIRKATIQDHEVLKVKSTWGYEVIIKVANKVLIK